VLKDKNRFININGNYNKAISVTLGVILLIIITVIVSLFFMTFSTSMPEKLKSVPVASFSVKIVKNASWYGYKVSFIQIEQIAGDAIPTSELMIITECKNNVTKVLPNSNNTHTYCAGKYCTDSNCYEWSYWVNGTSPYLNDPSVGFFGFSPKVDFGNYVTKPGVVMIADEYSNYNRTGPGNTTGMEAMFGENWWTWINKGDEVKIYIVHIPTKTIIFETKVVVE